MNPGDTVTLYGEEVEIIRTVGNKSAVIGLGWDRPLLVHVDSLRRLPHPDKSARWEDGPFRPSVGTAK